MWRNEKAQSVYILWWKDSFFSLCASLFFWIVWRKQTVYSQIRSVLCYYIFKAKRHFISRLCIYTMWHMYTHTLNGRRGVFLAESSQHTVANDTVDMDRAFFFLSRSLAFGFSFLLKIVVGTATALTSHTYRKASSIESHLFDWRIPFSHQWCAVFVVASTTEDATVRNKIAQIKYTTKVVYTIKFWKKKEERRHSMCLSEIEFDKNKNTK